MRNKYPVACPLLHGRMIDEGTCFDIHVVVDGTTPKDFAPKEIFEIDNYQDVCFRCKHHRYD